MTVAAAMLVAGLEALEADPALAARLARVFLTAPHAAERILLANVVAHGAPSSRWVTERARHGGITIRGPRGARYVLSSDLASLLATATIAKRKTATPAASTSLEHDARAAVVSLAARRMRTA